MGKFLNNYVDDHFDFLILKQGILILGPVLVHELDETSDKSP